MIQFKHKVKIFYRDIDKMGIVYYSRYYEYFEEARTEMLDSIGLSVTTIENYGIQLPVISSHCDYKKGAKFEQKLVVDTSISELPRVRLKINYLGNKSIQIDYAYKDIGILGNMHAYTIGFSF